MAAYKDDYPLSYQIEELVQEYLDSFKSSFAEVGDLNATQREELIELMQQQLGIHFDRRRYIALRDRGGLVVDDLINAALEMTQQDN